MSFASLHISFMSLLMSFCKLCLQKLIGSFSHKNVIHVPTRVTEMSQTLLALCFTNYQGNEQEAGVLLSDLSDHLPMFIFVTLHSTQRKEPTGHAVHAHIMYRVINGEKSTVVSKFSRGGKLELRCSVG